MRAPSPVTRAVATIAAVLCALAIAVGLPACAHGSAATPPDGIAVAASISDCPVAAQAADREPAQTAAPAFPAPVSGILSPPATHEVPRLPPIRPPAHAVKPVFHSVLRI
ncbi:hypothetical protein [Amycolatopsis sp. CA-230715]|uniref:hypothetical protein n=1 Tax=Amycolatopsis sp. CA-230715 TaxID=2745196 RepID=UPI001C024DFD|nr:hypothetical protein [Amycolatopsis sp. CA-230715]